MAKHRTHSIAFKRQVIRDFLAGVQLALRAALPSMTLTRTEGAAVSGHGRGQTWERQRGPAIVAAGRVRKSGRLPVREGVVTERRMR